MRPMVARLLGKVCLFMLSAIGGPQSALQIAWEFCPRQNSIHFSPYLSGFGMVNNNRRRIVLMVAMGAGVGSHSDMTFCDKPEKGVKLRLLCRLAQR